MAGRVAPDPDIDLFRAAGFNEPGYSLRRKRRKPAKAPTPPINTDQLAGSGMFVRVISLFVPLP